MLTLDEKRKILNSFEELREKEDKLGRFFYYYDKSPSRKKIFAREFVNSGNGYVFRKFLPEYKEVLYQDGSVCVKDFSSKELQDIVRKSINSLNNRR
ncbi:hypothetical protein F4694_005838 [Bacillus niacini]|uniref:Uncharacterized protein n=1 Tax=Neobacillus niacini TaxID=86668 RepID=A0A852TLE4_9BACI|nr:hypothetical protein [Neobacillus niacini]NYE08981.1 hypothetical protein [Neobacillus niacini]